MSLSIDPPPLAPACHASERVIDNLLVRIHFIIEMIWWTGLAISPPLAPACHASERDFSYRTDYGLALITYPCTGELTT